MSRVELYRRQCRSAWVFLDRYRADGITIGWRGVVRRWRAFWRVSGVDDHATVAGVLDKTTVATTGWTDLAEIRLVGQR